MKSSRFFCLTFASFFIFGGAEVFPQNTVSVSKNTLATSPKFSGSPFCVTEYRGASPDSLKKYSVLEFADGRISKERQFGDDGSEKTIVERKFLDDGKISEITGLDSSKNVKWRYSYGYDEKGLLASETSYSGSGEVEWRAEYSYNEKSRLSECRTYSAAGALNFTEKYIYTEDGRVKDYSSFYADGKLFKRVEYIYNADSTLAQEKNYDASGFYESVNYSYSNGKTSAVRTLGADGSLKTEETRTFSAGNMIRSVLKNAEGKTVSEKEFFYDWKGNCAMEKNPSGIIVRNFLYNAPVSSSSAASASSSSEKKEN
ncbi:hypothetical protein [uncultured Treponema sp.]|uniref:hypothetical protein n=1 Tax=uncultured Treponema sp. TaxID=162155 RepID=UPI00260F0EB7|nr:hypothetical protein [uncultured Treponema sp.]